MRRKTIWLLVVAIVFITTLLGLVYNATTFRATVREPTPAADLTISIPTWMLPVFLIVAIAFLVLARRHGWRLTETQMGILVTIGSAILAFAIFLFLEGRT